MLNELRGGKRTARELADTLNIQVSAARKHLEALSQMKIVREEFIQDGIGRPKKFYHLTEDGHELFPRQYSRILCGVIDRLDNPQGITGDAIAKEIARELANEIEVIEGDGGSAKVQSLVNALSDFGFDPSLEETNSSFVITSHNCPLHKAAMRHQKFVCHSFHDEIIKSALDTKDVKLEHCIARGDNSCKHIIDKRNL